MGGNDVFLPIRRAELIRVFKALVSHFLARKCREGRVDVNHRGRGYNGLGRQFTHPKHCSTYSVDWVIKWFKNNKEKATGNSFDRKKELIEWIDVH